MIGSLSAAGIGAFRSWLFCCVVPSALSYGSPVVVLLYHGRPCFRNFYSNVPVDVVRVKSYVNRPFDPTCVPIRITINKLYFVPERVVSAVVSVF